MARGEQPLLARTDSNTSSNLRAEEEDALLTGRPTSKTAEKKRRWREIGLSLWAFLATVVVIVLAIVVQHERSIADSRKKADKWGPDGKPKGKRNLIFMVSDGMGPTSLELTRGFRQYTEGLPFDDILELDKHFIGQSRTRSSSSLITDSAAGATAFSCGFKSYNGAISVLPDHSPCGTILEAAKRAGYMTGLVVTTRITDATPACFASHVQRREYEDLIAEQLIGHYPLGRVVDLIIGGGRCHFLPNTTSDSCRADSKDIVKMAKHNGFDYISTREEFDNLDAEGGVKLPLLALLANGDIPYEIDRVHVQDQYPSEQEMAKKALDALAAATTDSDQGFFLMIEGSRIDHAGHGNDPAAQVREVLAHDKAFATVVDFLNDSEDEGILISTSDHETGGLAAGRQVGKAYPSYVWFPSVLAAASHSASYLSHQYADYLTSHPTAHKKAIKSYLVNLLSTDFGIEDPTDKELKSLLDIDPAWPPSWIFADMISRRAKIGWSTHGHTAVDVNIFANDKRVAGQLAGNVENTDISKFMAEYLDLDLDVVTRLLIDGKVKTNITSVFGSSSSSAVTAGSGSESDDETTIQEINWSQTQWMGPNTLPIYTNNKDKSSGVAITHDEYHNDLETKEKGQPSRIKP